MKRLLIAGGGISGLCAAWRATSAGAAVEIRLLERDRRLGGKILTEHLDGCILEAAADGFLSRKRAGIALCEELGIAGRLQAQVPRKSRSFVAICTRAPPALTRSATSTKHRSAAGFAGRLASASSQPMPRPR